MKKLFFTLLIVTAFFTACKKNIQEIENHPIEIGTIKNHMLNASQAEKIAVLHSIYPEVLNKGLKQNVFNLPNGQKQYPQKNIKSIFALKEEQTNPTLFILNYE